MKSAEKRGALCGEGGSFEKMVAAYEIELLTEALKDTAGNQTETAKALGTTKRVVQYKVSQYGIEYKRFKD